MNNQTDESDTLKEISLSLINDARRAFGKEPLDAIKPTWADEDTDCVIAAISEAAGLSFNWGEDDGQKHWISTWEGGAEEGDRCQKLADAWGTTTRRYEDVWDVEVPPALAELAAKVAFDGEYPELVTE